MLTLIVQNIVKGGENMSVAPVSLQEVESCCAVAVIPDEIYEVVNQSLRALWYIEHEVRIIERNLIDEAFKRCNKDSARESQLKKFFADKDWWRRVVLEYESVGWKVKHDLIIKGVPRFVFTKP